MKFLPEKTLGTPKGGKTSQKEWNKTVTSFLLLYHGPVLPPLCLLSSGPATMSRAAIPWFSLLPTPSAQISGGLTTVGTPPPRYRLLYLYAVFYTALRFQSLFFPFDKSTSRAR